MPVLPFGSGKQTNVTGTAANITGTLAVAQGGTGATANTGTGNVVLSTSPTIATPAITGNMTVTGTNQDQGTNLQTIRSETTSDYVASGAVWGIGSGLIGAMNAGVVYIGGKRVPVTLITSKTFSTSFDTYVSVDNTGTVTYTAVANSAASPTLPANSVWLAIVVTGASAITSINQGQIGAVAPVVSGRMLMVSDTNGQLIYPSANQKILSYAQITAALNTASTTTIQIAGLTSTVIIPTGNRRIKITICLTVYNNTAGNGTNLSIWDGTVGSGTQLNATFYTSASANGQNAVTLIAIASPTASSKTYNVGYSANATTANINAAVAQPAFISVELM